VIPLAETLDVHGKPPLTLPSPPEMQSLGTKSDLAMNMKSRNENNLAEFKVKTYAKRERQERQMELEIDNQRCKGVTCRTFI
jgi:hypothetical protein